MAKQVDVIVLGMGVAGEAVAGPLAEAGLSVLGVEPGLVGGECPYWGCVPTKMMVRAAGLIAEARRVDDMAGRATVTPDWSRVAQRIRAEATDDWDDTVAVDRFVGKGGRFLRGDARISRPGVVAVDGQEYEATRGIVLATGAEPWVPPIPGLAGLSYWTNREAVQTLQPPTSLIVVGGGAIGVEFGQIFARFGSRVSIVETAAHLLPADEPEAAQVLADALAVDGIDIHVGVGVSAAQHSDDVFVVTLSDGTTLRAEQLLVATGRRPRLAGLGLEHYGIDPGAPLQVNAHLGIADGLWAVGDVTGHGAFTHVATYQAGIAVRDILGQPGPPASYEAVPRVTFTDPEVGSVGLTEAQALANGLNVRTGTAQVPSTARGWIHQSGNAGVIKVVEDVDRGVLVGATAAGPHGGEVLGALSLAVHAGVPVDTLRQMIYAYPTFHRGIEDALRDLRGA